MNGCLLTFVLASALTTAAPAGPKSAALKPPVPVFDPAGFAAVVDNPYFPLRPGTILVYETRAGRTTDVDTVTVTRETKTILGVRAVIVRDRTYRDSVLIEDTYDWYAQDRKGNVWYLGEDTKEYRVGKTVSTAGSWEAGRDSAHAGIIMPAVPEVGLEYRQEYRAGVAEDMARVLNLDAKATVLNDTFTACLETEDWSPLERGVRERKVYAPGLGLVLQRTVAGGDEWMKLVKVIAP
jgi:hypothetical protein